MGLKRKGLLFAALAIFGGCKQKDIGVDDLSIATGQMTGVYYQIGSSLCRHFKSFMSTAGEDRNCFTRPTPASVYNLNFLHKGEVNFAFTQADMMHYAFLGERSFKTVGKFDDLRVVMTLYDEAYSTIVKRDSGIENFEDIKGHIISVGAAGSGMRDMTEQIKSEYGWTSDDFKAELDIKASEQANKLCDGNLDVMIYTVGHPNAAVKSASAQCDIKFLSLDTPQIRDLISRNPFYELITIPASIYPSGANNRPSMIDGDGCKTLAVKTMVVTKSTTPDALVTSFIDSVMTNFNSFKDIHPALASLTKEQILNKGETEMYGVPIHPAALAYEIKDVTQHGASVGTAVEQDTGVANQPQNPALVDPQIGQEELQDLNLTN